MLIGSLGFFGPVLEEIIFRGMLLEDCTKKREVKAVIFLDFVACLFFALLHVPVSFVVPLILAVAFIYVRRRSASLGLQSSCTLRGTPQFLSRCSWQDKTHEIKNCGQQNAQPDSQISRFGFHLWLVRSLVSISVRCQEMKP